MEMLGTRKSIPLSPRDLRDLKVLRGSPAHRAVLSQLSEIEVTDRTSEAAVLHAVLEAGLRAVERQVELEGYAQIAAEAEPVHRVARRRRPTWADE